MVLDDEFNTGSLNTSLWSPDWFGNGQVENGTVMLSSNVSVGANGLALQLNSPQSGGLVSTNPDDASPGTPGSRSPRPRPSPSSSSSRPPCRPRPAGGGQLARPVAGRAAPLARRRRDRRDGGRGRLHRLPHPLRNRDGEGPTARAVTINDLSGTHTYGVLWTTTSVTFVYDGADVGTIDQALDSPMYIVMENSYSSVDPTVFPATMDVRYVRVWN
jgi:hypothetical protein